MPHIIVQYPRKSEGLLPMLDGTLRPLQEGCYIAYRRVPHVKHSQDFIILAGPRMIFLVVHDSLCSLPLCVSGLGRAFARFHACPSFSAKNKAALAAFVTLVSRRFLSRFSSGFRHHSMFSMATSPLHPGFILLVVRRPIASALPVPFFPWGSRARILACESGLCGRGRTRTCQAHANIFRRPALFISVCDLLFRLYLPMC